MDLNQQKLIEDEYFKALSALVVDFQTFSFMHAVKCSNEPNHEACIHNKCTDCVDD